MGCTSELRMRKCAHKPDVHWPYGLDNHIPIGSRALALDRFPTTPPYIIKARGLRMIVLVSLIRGLPCFHDFSHDTYMTKLTFWRVNTQSERVNQKE